mmetsp:Transcript_1871/g.4934  ORF Transcript_1871/g.4934 Transcript_1871/m.4934 type:complete len:353 (+) Transcript_1871:489-1547(+)|eukprot:CAMPEP_0172379158 /NCGR_PEP_ID=MMETSP1060-20121228/69788_1 /TAXON_ID=37318 /ORGANISM="Pseudo-nitzschia pungens, Strain cf. cingulata" /LENGTH=352 /DNA_ID=CAMNT_0013106895 /DNA_START=3256 /DNA_END=4314 /DNA_ORIENTATION=+
MPIINSALSNFMNRRNAELVETEEPQDEEAHRRGISDDNSITEEDGEEGEFVGETGRGSMASSQRTPMLEALPDDEDVNSNSSSSNTTSRTGTGEEPQSRDSTSPAATQSTSGARPRTIRGYTLRDLEEEREVVQRRTAGCVLLSSFLLLRLWVQAIMTGDLGLLLLCLVFTSWVSRFVRYTREREEELNRMINEWDENATDEPSSLTDARLRRMSFQSQLALAIMQSQIQLMEGGYGHPDGGENGAGVGDSAKGHWDRFEFKSAASLLQRSHYGSVVDEKDGAKGGSGKTVDDEEPTCSICLCEYEKGDKLVSLPCNHVFHEDCITSWTDHNTRCPLCNTDLDSVRGDGVV